METGRKVIAASMVNGLVYPTFTDTLYIKWGEYEGPNGTVRYISEVTGDPAAAMRLEEITENRDKYESLSEVDLPSNITFIPYSEGGVNPYTFLKLYSVEVLNAYNSLLYKKTSNEKFCRSRARDRPSAPNEHIAVTKAHSEVDIDYPDESPFNDDNHIDYEGYAYLNASSSWRGTYSISASAYSYSPSESGKWWSGVYKMLNPIQTVGYGNNLNDSYAINYFSNVSGKASVEGIRYQSDPTNTFESEADAHNFSYNSSVTWRCQRSGYSNIHNGSLCPICN